MLWEGRDLQVVNMDNHTWLTAGDGQANESRTKDTIVHTDQEGSIDIDVEQYSKSVLLSARDVCHNMSRVVPDAEEKTRFGLV